MGTANSAILNVPAYLNHNFLVNPEYIYLHVC